MKRSRILRLIAVLAALALFAGACSSGSDSGGSGDLKTGDGVTSDTITLGLMSDLSGPAGALGKPIVDGQKAYWDYVNANGGVAGRQIKVVVEDHQYNPQTAQAAYEKIKSEILGLPLLLGTPISEALKPVLEEDKVLTSPASLSSGLATDPFFVMVGTPYAMSTGNAVAEIVKNQGGEGKKIALIYQNDDYGKDALKGWEVAKETYTFDEAAQITYNATDTQFNEQISQLVGSGADFVVIAGLPTQAAGILGGAAQQGFTKPAYGLAPVWNRALLKSPAADLIKQVLKIVSAQAYWGEDVSGMKTMLDAVDQYQPAYKDNPNDYFTFGWTQALVYHAIMEKAVDLGDITRDGMETAFSKVGKVDTGGLLPPLDYGDSPDTRVPSREDRISEPVADDSSYPAELKPITDYFESEAAKKVQVGDSTPDPTPTS